MSNLNILQPGSILSDEEYNLINKLKDLYSNLLLTTLEDTYSEEYSNKEIKIE